MPAFITKAGAKAPHSTSVTAGIVMGLHSGQSVISRNLPALCLPLPPSARLEHREFLGAAAITKMALSQERSPRWYSVVYLVS